MGHLDITFLFYVTFIKNITAKTYRYLLCILYNKSLLTKIALYCAQNKLQQTSLKNARLVADNKETTDNNVFRLCKPITKLNKIQTPPDNEIKRSWPLRVRLSKGDSDNL